MLQGLSAPARPPTTSTGTRSTHSTGTHAHAPVLDSFCSLQSHARSVLTDAEDPNANPEHQAMQTSPSGSSQALGTLNQSLATQVMWLDARCLWWDRSRTLGTSTMEALTPEETRKLKVRPTL